MQNPTVNFFCQKKLSDTSKMVVLAILGPNLRPLLEIENFFFSKFNIILDIFRVKFTGNYYVVGIIWLWSRNNYGMIATA